MENQPIQEQQPPPTPNAPQHHKFRVVLIALGGLLLFGLGALGGYFLATKSEPKITQQIQSPTANQKIETTPTTKPINTNTAVSKYPVYPIKVSYKTPSFEETSPDGMHTITEKMEADYSTIVLKDKQNNIIADDIVALNEDVIGYGKKFGCQCDTHIGGWYSNTQFILKIGNAIGEEYEYLGSATNGRLDESSFQRVR